MFTKQLLDKVLITLERGEQTILFILLQKDGTIHRKGDGNALEDLPLATGHSPDGHFEALLMTVEESLFVHAGVLKMPDRLGHECRLTIIFQGKQDLDIAFRVVYGDQSQGPPLELAQILINAVKLTEPWYRQQIQAVVQPEKSWWKFWE